MNEKTESRPEAPASGPFTRFADAIGTRNLYIAIATMPVVFLVVVMATLSAIGRPAEKETAAVAGSVLSQPAEFAAATQANGPADKAEALAAIPIAAAAAAAPLVLARGAKVGAMALDGDRLALRIENENGGEIVIYDLARGAVIQRIPIMPQQSAAPDEGL